MRQQTLRELVGLLREAAAVLGEQGKPSPEHRTHERCLQALARAGGFTRKVRWHNLPRQTPDVFAATPDLSAAFLGDAKAAANEPATRQASVTRIRRYVRRLLKNQRLRSGYLAIATDDRETASAWGRELTKAVTDESAALETAVRSFRHVRGCRGSWVALVRFKK